jgi:histidine ammonia-lyase
MAVHASGQGMQPPSGNVHVVRALRSIKVLELTTESRGVMGLNAGFGALTEERLDATMSEALDHVCSVA